MKERLPTIEETIIQAKGEILVAAEEWDQSNPEKEGGDYPVNVFLNRIEFILHLLNSSPNLKTFLEKTDEPISFTTRINYETYKGICVRPDAIKFVDGGDYESDYNYPACNIDCESANDVWAKNKGRKIISFFGNLTYSQIFSKIWNHLRT